MDYICWRCGHGVEKTAVGCSGCGKALTPVKWFGWPRARERLWSPRAYVDAVVIDSMERRFLPTMLVSAMVWFALVPLSAWVILKSRELVASAIEWHAEVRASMGARGDPQDLRDFVESMMRFQTGALEGLATVGWGFIVLASVGIYLSLYSYFMVRRLLRAIPAKEGSPAA